MYAGGFNRVHQWWTLWDLETLQWVIWLVYFAQLYSTRHCWDHVRSASIAFCCCTEMESLFRRMLIYCICKYHQQENLSTFMLFVSYSCYDVFRSFPLLLCWLSMPTSSSKLLVWWKLLQKERLLLWYTANLPTRWGYCHSFKWTMGVTLILILSRMEEFWGLSTPLKPHHLLPCQIFLSNPPHLHTPPLLVLSNFTLEL